MEILLFLLSIALIGLPSHMIARSVITRTSLDIKYLYPLTIVITAIALFVILFPL
jgi:hypothetical protein